MKVYKLKHKEYDGDLVFGLPYPYNESPGEIYINELFKNMKPWNHCVPYYKNSHFAFVSINALCTFLFGYFGKSDLTEEILSDIEDKFYVQTFNLTVWSDGLSKFLCTYFDDEIETIEDTREQQYDMKTVEGFTYKYIVQDPVAEDDISMCKERYYKNVKTFY